jgi:hypothetical protein
MGKDSLGGITMSKAEEINTTNRELAERLRPMVREAKSELEAVGEELLEAQARRDAALDHYKRLSDRLDQAEVDAKRTPLMPSTTY